MKKILFVLPVTFSLFIACKNEVKVSNEPALPNVAQHTTTPVKTETETRFGSALDYNNFIVIRQTAIANLIIQFADDSKTDLSKASRTIDEAITKVDQTITDIQTMPDWNGNTVLRDNALPLFRFYKTIFSKDYKRVIAMKKDDVISEDEKAEYNQMMERITTTESKLDTDFKTAQAEFASSNGLGVAANDMQQKIDDLKKGQ